MFDARTAVKMLYKPLTVMHRLGGIINIKSVIYHRPVCVGSIGKNARLSVFLLNFLHYIIHSVRIK